MHYKVRRSARAKNVRISVSERAGIEVVLPVGFDRRRLPELLDKKRDWIDKALNKLRLGHLPIAETVVAQPTDIYLAALECRWHVIYRPTNSNRLTLTEQGNLLRLSGDVQDREACGQALRRWLARKGREHLVKMLAEAGADTGLSYGLASIRNQRSRWASCSRRGTISLNCRLLFVRRELVRYTLVHELCHTVQANHSVDFWAEVQRWEPRFRDLRAELRQAWRRVPEWVHA